MASFCSQCPGFGLVDTLLDSRNMPTDFAVAWSSIVDNYLKIYISVKQIEAMIMLTIATKHAEIQQEFHSKGFIDMIQSTSICNRSG